MFFILTSLIIGLYVASGISMSHNNINKGILFGIAGFCLMIITISYYKNKSNRKNNLKKTNSSLSFLDFVDCDCIECIDCDGLPDMPDCGGADCDCGGLDC